MERGSKGLGRRVRELGGRLCRTEGAGNGKERQWKVEVSKDIANDQEWRNGEVKKVNTWR